MKLDYNENSFKQLEYFSMANWKKLEILSIDIQGETLDIKNIEDKFAFSLFQRLEIIIFYFYERFKDLIIKIESDRREETTETQKIRIISMSDFRDIDFRFEQQCWITKVVYFPLEEMEGPNIHCPSYLYFELLVNY